MVSSTVCEASVPYSSRTVSTILVGPSEANQPRATNQLPFYVSKMCMMSACSILPYISLQTHTSIYKWSVWSLAHYVMYLTSCDGADRSRVWCLQVPWLTECLASSLTSPRPHHCLTKTIRCRIACVIYTWETKTIYFTMWFLCLSLLIFISGKL